MEQARFSMFHEIGHYVLPDHVASIMLCSKSDMSYLTQRLHEKQANTFAVNLLFHGKRFTQQANSHAITARSVAELANDYQASFEATVRRLVEKNIRPCMLIVYEKRRMWKMWEEGWDIQYYVQSPAFQHRFIGQWDTAPNNPDVSIIAVSVHNIIDSKQVMLPYTYPAEEPLRCKQSILRIDIRYSVYYSLRKIANSSFVRNPIVDNGSLSGSGSASMSELL